MTVHVINLPAVWGGELSAASDDLEALEVMDIAASWHLGALQEMRERLMSAIRQIDARSEAFPRLIERLQANLAKLDQEIERRMAELDSLDEVIRAVKAEVST